MSASQVTQENSIHPPKDKRKRGGTKTITSSQGWPVSFRSKTINYPPEEEQSESIKDGKVKIMKKKTFNFLQNVQKLIPYKHVHSLLKQITINENSIRDPHSEEALIRSIFYIRSINFVRVMSDYLVFGLIQNQDSTSIPYLVERFNSYGDAYFHEKAQEIEAISQAYAKQPPRPKDTPELAQKKRLMIEEFLANSKGKAYFAKVAGENLIISKQLLRLLGREPEEFAKECLRYRAILDEIFSAVSYRYTLDKTLEFVMLNVEFLMGKITIEEVMKKADVTYPTEIRGKNETAISILLHSYMPNPFMLCAMVVKVFGEQKIENAKLHKIEGPSRQKYVEQMLEQKQQLIGKLNPKPAPKKEVDDSHLRCSYRPMQPEDQE